MTNSLVVFGATGQQGGSVIDYVLNDKDLAAQYKIRAITRNTTGDSAKALAGKGVEVVVGDAEKPETLKDALEGAHTVFVNTPSVYDDKLVERELSSGKAIADTSVAAGAKYIIYSSSTPAISFTGRAVPAFDCKYEVEEYIRTLPIKSAFYAAGTFMQNWATMQKPRPCEQPGVYAISNIIDPSVKLPAIDIVADTGKFVGAILAEPDKYNGKVFYAASQMLTMQEVVETISKATGKTVKYDQYPEDVFKNFLPPPMQEPLCAMFAYFNDPGYYGPDTKDRVEWTTAQARGRLTTYEEHLRANPLSLD